MTPTLKNLGWTEHFATQIGPEEDRYLPGRVAFESRGIYHVLSEAGSLLCELKGILRKGVKDRSVYPVVGDWVLMEAPNAKPGQSLEKNGNDPHDTMQGCFGNFHFHHLCYIDTYRNDYKLGTTIWCIVSCFPYLYTSESAERL